LSGFAESTFPLLQGAFKSCYFVIPAQAGNQFDQTILDARLGGHDGNSILE
jgi:hypothetical protein